MPLPKWTPPLTTIWGRLIKWIATVHCWEMSRVLRSPLSPQTWMHRCWTENIDRSALPTKLSAMYYLSTTLNLLAYYLNCWYVISMHVPWSITHMNCQWLYESVLQSACITVNFQSQMCYNRTRLSLQTTAAFEAQLGCPSLATLTLFSGFLPSCFNLIETTNRALTYPPFCCFVVHPTVHTPAWECRRRRPAAWLSLAGTTTTQSKRI